MKESDIEQSLGDVARSLRGPNERRVNVLRVAESLGLQVSVALHDSPDSTQARIELQRRPPMISIFRASETRGNRRLGVADEWMLTRRERFSVAHEIGHWIASKQIGVSQPSGTRDYWLQERWMNTFAGSLLVPEWLLQGWLAETPEEEPVPPVAVWRWATHDLHVSEEVLASAIARVRPSSAFVKLVRTSKRSDSSSVLKVQFSAADSLQVPARGTHICDAHLDADLSNRSMGRKVSPQWTLGRCPPQDVILMWRTSSPKVESYPGPTVCWLSMTRLAERTAPLHETASLF